MWELCNKEEKSYRLSKFKKRAFYHKKRKKWPYNAQKRNQQTFSVDNQKIAEWHNHFRKASDQKQGMSKV